MLQGAHGLPQVPAVAVAGGGQRPVVSCAEPAPKIKHLGECSPDLLNPTLPRFLTLH